MGSEVLRYVVPPKYGDNGPLFEALRILNEINWKTGRSKEVTLFIPTKHQLDGTLIDASLGENVCKRLSKGDKVAIGDELILKCETNRTFKPYLSNKTILCIYPNEKMLDAVDTVDDIEVAVVIPWLELEEVKRWLKTWNPIILGEDHIEPTDKLIDNPVVEEAMKLLTKRINLSTGLAHPRDKGATVDLLRKLRDKNEHFDPDSLKAWALRNNWTPKGAEDLRVYAQAIIDRKRIRGDNEAWKSNIVTELRKRVYSK